MDRITIILDPMLLLLAQAKVRREVLGADVIIWAGIMMAVLLGFGFIWMIIRSKVRQSDTSEAESMFSLGTLRRMHREGQLNDAEFEKAKAIVIGTMAKEKPTEDSEGISFAAASMMQINDLRQITAPTDGPEDDNDAEGADDNDDDKDADNTSGQGPDNQSDSDEQDNPPDPDLDEDEKSA